MRIRYKHRFDKERRDIIKTISAAGISPGLLKASSLVGGMMVARATEAQSGPNKSILLLAVGGAIDSRWRPDGGLKPMSAAYSSVRNDMQFLVGGSMTDGGHGLMFGRFNGGGDKFSTDSFDVNVGRTIGVNRPVRYLNVGVQSGGTNLSRQGNAAVPTIDSPITAFNRLFGGGGGDGGGDGTADPRIQFVDAHKEALDALRQKLGQHEKERLDSHVSAIEDFERSILPSDDPDPDPAPTSCNNVSQPTGSNASDFDTIAKAQIEVALLGLKCNVTSSVSISFGNDQHGFRIPGYNDVFHQSHHCCGHTDFYDITANYMSSLVARTISRTKAEGLLDSTIITQVTDMGDGRSHGNSNVPMTMAGGGTRKGGSTSISGKTQIDVFAAVARRLGVTDHPDGKSWTNSPITI